MTKNTKILTSNVFIIFLVILLVNDFILKETFNNWITGKLSDFVGLFIFPIFWSSLIPKHKNKIYFITFFGFIYWKSEFSEPLINTWNNLSGFTLSRVVDYTDLIALTFIPIAYIFQNRDDYKRIKVNPVIPICISSFAFMATSYSTVVEINKSYKFNFDKSTLEKKLTQVNEMNSGRGLIFSDQNPDTITLTIISDFCFDGYDVELSLIDLKDSMSILTFLKANHSCPSEDGDEKQILNEFEDKVIKKIKNVP